MAETINVDALSGDLATTEDQDRKASVTICDRHLNDRASVELFLDMLNLPPFRRVMRSSTKGQFRYGRNKAIDHEGTTDGAEARGA